MKRQNVVLRFFICLVISAVLFGIIYAALSSIGFVTGSFDKYLDPGEVFPNTVKFFPDLGLIEKYFNWIPGWYDIVDDIHNGIEASGVESNKLEGALFTSIAFGLIVVAVERFIVWFCNLITKPKQTRILSDTICTIPPVYFAISIALMLVDAIAPVLRIANYLGGFVLLVILIFVFAAISWLRRNQILSGARGFPRTIFELLLDVVAVLLLYEVIMSGYLLAMSRELTANESFRTVLVFLFSLLLFNVVEALRFSGSFDSEK